MTFQSFLSLNASDLESMSMSELRKAAKTGFSAANKRISRLEQAENIAEDALRKVKREGGKFTSGGKDREHLISEIRRAQRFGKSPTSTVSGARKEYERRKGNGISGRETSIINTWIRMTDDGEVVYKTKSEIVRQVMGYAAVVSELDFSDYTDEEIVSMIDNDWQKPGDMVGEDDDWETMGDDDFWD